MLDAHQGNPYILPGWSFTRLPEGNGVLLFSVTRKAHPVQLKGPLPGLFDLLRLCDGNKSLESIIATLAGQLSAETVGDILSALQRRKILGFLSEAEHAIYSHWNRYLRQIEYFEDYLGSRAASAAAQERLAQTHVVIVGVGGVGNWLVQALAAIGISHFTLVDPDVVELSNLSRQVLFSPTDVGRPKVAAAAQWITHFQPNAEVRGIQRGIYSEDDMELILPNTSLIIRTAGYVPSALGRMINRVALRKRTPYLSVGGSSYGPFVIADETSCFGCLEQMLKQTEKITFTALKTNPRFARETHTPVFVPPLGIAALWAVYDIALYVTRIASPQSINRVIHLDMERLTIGSIAVPRSRECPDCSPLREEARI
jgi:bacteriocin biosynthesis cyclodehydratase domain-containing protein